MRGSSVRRRFAFSAQLAALRDGVSYHGGLPAQRRRLRVRDFMSVSRENTGGAAEQAPLLVTCLCAAWCGVCNQFRPVFESLAQRHPQWRFVWLDVEDREDVMGSVDVETFPTVMLSRQQQLLFFGPVLPQAGVLQRMLEALVQDTAPAQVADKDAAQLLQRLLGATDLEQL